MGTRQLGQLLNRAVELLRDEGPGALLDATTAFLAHSTGRRVRALERSARARYFRARYGDAAPRPYELISVDPSEIRYFTCPGLHCKYPDVELDSAYVRSGDWDRLVSEETVFTRYSGEFSIVELDDWVFYRSMMDHFTDDVPWPETEWYRRVASEGGLKGEYYSDVETMEKRLAAVDDLYDSIRERGYKTQAELLAESEAPFEVPLEPCPEHHEIVVNVGRDGELIFEEGKHRLAVAKALDLDRIPVRVLVRHARWQALRHRVATATDTSDLSATALDHLDHPDVRAVAPPELTPSRREPDAPSELRP